MSLYTIKSLTFSYPKSDMIFENMNLSFDKNQRIGLIGPNGCGKTTLAKLMLGIMKPQKGEIYLEDENIKNMSLSSMGRKVGFIFQNPEKQLFAPTVWEQMIFGGKEVNDKADYYLELFGLTNYKDELPFNLSFGQKQRLAIASVLSRDVIFVILDEPSTGLDIAHLKKLELCLRTLTKEDRGYMIISHDNKFLLNNVDKLLSFKDKGVEFL